jgi:hypothetical protein
MIMCMGCAGLAAENGVKRWRSKLWTKEGREDLARSLFLYSMFLAVGIFDLLMVFSVIGVFLMGIAATIGFGASVVFPSAGLYLSSVAQLVVSVFAAVVHWAPLWLRGVAGVTVYLFLGFTILSRYQLTWHKKWKHRWEGGRFISEPRWYLDPYQSTDLVAWTWIFLWPVLGLVQIVLSLSGKLDE